MKILLQTGRTITLARIEQWRTYAGLLCGQPTREQNAEKLQDLLERACSQYNLQAAVLIPPPVGARLPATCCVATFDSNALARPDRSRTHRGGIGCRTIRVAIDARVVELIRR